MASAQEEEARMVLIGFRRRVRMLASLKGDLSSEVDIEWSRC